MLKEPYHILLWAGCLLMAFTRYMWRRSVPNIDGPVPEGWTLQMKKIILLRIRVVLQMLRFLRLEEISWNGVEIINGLNPKYRSVFANEKKNTFRGRTSSFIKNVHVTIRFDYPNWIWCHLESDHMVRIARFYNSLSLSHSLSISLSLYIYITDRNA